MATKSTIDQNTPRMVQIKLMYWGPGESGKTTNFHRLQEIFEEHMVSNPMSIATTMDRTLWNDAVIFNFDIRSMNVSLFVNVNTTTGQERFLTTREYVLQNADGVVFVGDSDPDKMADNIRSFQELVAFTQDTHIPILIQLNKRDLPNAISEMRFRRAMKLPEIDKDEMGFPIVYEAIASNREDPLGVKTCFLDLLQKVLICISAKK